MNLSQFAGRLTTCEQIKNRVTPAIVSALDKNQIFVFGSNLAGRHGKGAAKQAMQWGAIYGHPHGLQGQTYAIPTKNYSITKALGIEEIRLYVNQFILFAKLNNNLIFLVTEIGCGLAGYSPNDIAPLFSEAVFVENIFLPEKFQKIIS